MKSLIFTPEPVSCAKGLVGDARKMLEATIKPILLQKSQSDCIRGLACNWFCSYLSGQFQQCNWVRLCLIKDCCSMEFLKVNTLAITVFNLCE